MRFKLRDTDRNSAHTNKGEQRAACAVEDRLSGDAISDRQQRSNTPPDRGNPHAVEGVRDPEDFLRAPLSGTAAREHGRERRKRMFRVSRIAEGNGSRQASRMRKAFSKEFIRAQQWENSARHEQAWFGGPNGI